MESLKILIIDDDKASSNFLLKVFSDYGDCDIAIDGIEAVDAFILALEEGVPYELISLDLMLPLLEGENVLAAIRKIENDKRVDSLKRVKVIVTSALNDTGLTRDLEKFGISGYFMKPLDVDQIKKFISSIQL